MEIHLKGDRVVEFKNSDYKIVESQISTNRIVASNYSSNHFLEYEMSCFESEHFTIYTFEKNVWSKKIKSLIREILQQKSNNSFIIQKTAIEFGIGYKSFSIWELLPKGSKICYFLSKDSNSSEFESIINKKLNKMFPSFNISIICACSAEYPGVVDPTGFRFPLLECKEEDNPLEFFNFLL